MDAERARHPGEAAEGLRLSEEQAQAILEHVRAEYPNEACGLLGGKGGRVERVFPLPNAKPSPFAYEADPVAVLRAILEMEGQGWEPVPLAIYHSHPHSAAFPSPTDVRLAYYPEAIYLIVSLEQPDKPSLRAFRIVDGRISEEKILIDSRSS